MSWKHQLSVVFVVCECFSAVFSKASLAGGWWMVDCQR